MIDQFAEMKHVERLKMRAVRGAEKASIETSMINGVMQAKDAFLNACAAFNNIREILANIKGQMFDCANLYPGIAKRIREARGVDIENYVASIYAEDYEPCDDFEDGEKFLVELEKVTSERDPFKVMRLARKMKMSLDATIERWESKLIKMKETAESPSCVNPDLYITKIKLFDMMVDALKKRKETVTIIFNEAKDKINSFLKRETLSFNEMKEKKEMKLTI